MFNNNRNNNIVRKGRTYNFCLNSNFTLTQTFGGNNIPPATCNFYVDWSVLPEGEYKVSFTFTSVNTASDLENTTNAVLYLDLGQSSTSIIESSSTLSKNSYRSGFLGCLRQNSYATATDFITSVYADLNTNPPVYIFSRPRNNSVIVDINTSSVDTTTNFSPIGGYVLTLSFVTLSYQRFKDACCFPNRHWI
jgi:hypothetical protein